jgi:hypothetical protein
MEYGAFNKAWVSLIMSALILIEAWTEWSIPEGINEQWIITVLTLLTPIIVWAVPNYRRA